MCYDYFVGRTTYYPKLQRLDKLSKEEHADLAFDLINAFSLVKTPVESAFLLNDLLTKKEIENLAKRLRIAKLLVEGIKQREIAKELHCSFGTVSKVSAWLAAGGEGLNRVIAKLPKRTTAVRYKRRYPQPNLPVMLAATIQHLIYTKDKKLVENFLSSLEEKNLIDRQLREMIHEEFASKTTSLHKQSLLLRGSSVANYPKK